MDWKNWSIFIVLVIFSSITWAGSPYVRPMEPILAIAGKSMKVICPVAGYPIDSITWERENVRLPTNM